MFPRFNKYCLAFLVLLHLTFLYSQSFDKQLLFIENNQYVYPDSAFSLCLKLEEKIKKSASNKKYLIPINTFKANILWHKGNFSGSLDSYREALDLAKDSKNQYRECTLLSDIGYLHSEKGEKDSAIFYFIKSSKIADKLGDNLLKMRIKMFMADFYSSNGEYQTALNLYLELLDFYSKKNNSYDVAAMNSNIALCYLNLGKIPLAKSYFDKSIEKFKKLRSPSELGETYQNFAFSFIGKDNDYALKLIHEAKENFLKAKADYNYLASLDDEALILNKLAHKEKSIKLYQEVIGSAKNKQYWYILKSAYKGISDSYYDTKNFDKALYYLKKYHEIKDKISNDENRKVIGEMQIKYKTEKKEKENSILKQSNKIKELQLNKSKIWLFTLVSIILILFLLVSLIYIRIKSKSKIESIRQAQKENEFKQKLTEIELKALRAQMNPHFIFNCISSIQNCIENKNNEIAEKYLSKFSVLLRMILESSKKSFINLADEIKLLALYLEMEQFRHDNKFDFSFLIDSNVETDNFEIPNMILQPFYENAIIHGLLSLKQKGKISTSIKLVDDEFLCIEISDNGIGRKKSGEMKRNKNHNSTGINNIYERLKIFEQNESTKYSMEIIDLYDENKQALGTKIKLILPIC